MATVSIDSDALSVLLSAALHQLRSATPEDDSTMIQWVMAISAANQALASTAAPVIVPSALIVPKAASAGTSPVDPTTLDPSVGPTPQVMPLGTTITLATASSPAITGATINSAPPPAPPAPAAADPAATPPPVAPLPPPVPAQ